MSSKVTKLLSVYRQHLSVPWQAGLAAIQRVVFAVYDKSDELRLRANLTLVWIDKMKAARWPDALRARLAAHLEAQE